jgi:hypothetical protein
MAILFALAVVNCGIGVSSAKAGELVFGLGQDNIDDDRYSEAFALQLEYHADPIFEYDWGIISVFGVLEVDDDSDIYVVAGVATLWDISASWFVEASLAAGYYDRGSDSLDLGGNIQFRTLIGLGYRLSKKSGLSIALEHIGPDWIRDSQVGLLVVPFCCGRYGGQRWVNRILLSCVPARLHLLNKATRIPRRHGGCAFQ